MGVRVGELDPRQMERLRSELAETIADTFAYPSYFDYRRGRQVTRPIDRAGRDTIEQFLRSANFSALDQVDVSSPELRRYIERLLLRYLDVNEQWRAPRLARRLSAARAQIPRVAGELQRTLASHLDGRAPSFGSRRQRASWASVIADNRTSSQREATHQTRVLETVLVRHSGGLGQHAPASAPATPASPPQWAGLPTDVTVPAPTVSAASRPPYSAVEARIPSFGASDAIAERPTGPLPTPPHTPPAPNAASAYGQPRELPADLVDLYGDYLRDMQPEVAQPPRYPSAPPVAISAQPSAPSPFRQREESAAPYAPPRHVTSAPASFAAPTAPPAPDPTQARSDKLIFWQLRYQLEAYVRRAARSYGVQTQGDDPAVILDALRRSSFVDEADLRIAEGILALTDRVTAQHTATVDDYRQALMLYLLYHRSHLA